MESTCPSFHLILMCWTDFVSVLGFNELIRTGPFLFLFFLLVMFVSGQQLAGGRILRGSQLKFQVSQIYSFEDIYS